MALAVSMGVATVQRLTALQTLPLGIQAYRLSLDLHESCKSVSVITGACALGDQSRQQTSQNVSQRLPPQYCRPAGVYEQLLQ